jgi:hypothetical protein
MLTKIESIIAREEAFLAKFEPGTSQHSLLANRIAALRTVCELITGDCLPTREELEFAVLRIESIIHKMSASRDKYESGSRNYKRFDPTVRLMEEAKVLIEKALAGTSATWLDEVKAKLKRRNQILFGKDSLLLQELSLLISNSNRRSLTLWSLSLAEQIVKDFEHTHPDESIPRNTLIAAKAWAAGEIKMPVAKRAILDCHALAKEMTDPADSARCHAIAQGCSVVHTTGHALGLPIYELTAIVRELGVDHCKDAIEQRNRSYIDTLLYWQEHEADYEGSWAGFLK